VQLKWTDLAEVDLDRIEDYISQENDRVVAIDVVLKVINTTELILPNHPHAGRLGRLKGTRELVVDGVPFVVIYRIVESLNQLQILRVMHDSRRWPPES
jgi:toxin ParE1/3/4